MDGVKRVSNEGNVLSQKNVLPKLLSIPINPRLFIKVDFGLI